MAFAIDENKWIKLDDHCIRPYGYAAPVFCFEYTLPDSEIVLVPQLPTTTTQTTTTTTITSSSGQSYTEQQTTTSTNKLSTISTTTIPVVNQSTQIFIAGSVCSTLLLLFIGVVIAYKVSLLM